MFRRKAHALALAALLAAGALLPRAAHGDAATADVTPGVEPARVVSETPETVEAPAPAAPAPADAPVETKVEVAPPAPAAQDVDSKREGNAFLRALAAPFRALARLFGGGRKSSDGVAKRRGEKPAEAKQAEAKQVEAKQTEAQPAPRVAENAAEPKATEVAEDPFESKTTEDFVPAPAPQSPPPAPSPAAEQSVRIVRPDEEALAPPVPRVWTPVIEGIGKDPLTQGRALLERGQLQEAVAELSIAAAAGGSGNLVEANNLLGLAYDRLGRHRQAAEAYGRGLTVAPRDPVLLANFGFSLYLAGDLDGALKRLREAARLAPAQPVVHSNLGLVQARLGKYDDAFKSLARAHGEYDAHLRLAGLLESVSRERQAIKHYEAALQLQPGTTAVLERLLSLYERTGDRIKADTARRTLGKPRNDQRTTTGGG